MQILHQNSTFIPTFAISFCASVHRGIHGDQFSQCSKLFSYNSPAAPKPALSGAGDQGKSVVRALTSAGCFRIRALVAVIDMKDVVRLQAEFPLLEVLQAGQEKKEEMEDALQGCYAAFIVSDVVSYVRTTCCYIEG